MNEDELRDPRVVQANERTLLAWLRTGIGLMAFGFVVARSSAWMKAVAGREADDGGPFAWIGIALVA
jgi:putative membrane protein